MKILHVITRLDFGGSSENVLFSAQGSAAAGREVAIASGPSSAISDAAIQIKVPCIVLPDLVRAINPWHDFKAFIEIIHLLRQWKPDIIHTHSSKAGILGRWSAWMYRKWLLPAGAPSPRIIHTPHGHVFYGYFGPIKSWLFLSLERLTAKITDDLIALSEGEKRESLDLGVGVASQWTVIHSGVSMSDAGREAASIRIPDRAIVIGCIARLDPVKGVDILIEAVPAVRSDPAGRDAVFLIVGDGERKRILESRARELGVVDAVIFTGYQKEPRNYLGMMDIYIQPSLNEGMGKTLVMAGTVGLPIVASRVCGIPDVVRDGETGILVPPADPKALAHALLRFLSDESLRNSMGKAAQHWVTSADDSGYPRFSVESMVAQLEKLYSRA